MNIRNLGFTKLILFLAGCLFFSSCSYKNRNAILKTPYDADSVKNVYVVNAQAQTENYYNLIKPEDEIIIRNLQDKDLIVKNTQGGGATAQNTTYRVNAEGDVYLPIIGKVNILGLSRKQANEKIQSAYEKSELKNPIIDLQIVNMYVNLFGEVGKAGKYVINREDYDLIDLLGEAGGVPVTANRKMVKIFRGDRSNPEIIIVNLNDFSFIKDRRLKLQNKDIIYVEPRRIVTTGQNLQAYSTVATLGLLVVNTFLIIYNLSK